MEHQTHFSEITMKSIDIDPDSDELYWFSARVGFLIDAAEHIASQSCPALTVDEWCAITEAGNGSTHVFEGGFKPALLNLWIGIQDAAHTCNKKWSVNCQTLASRLSGMSPAEQLAVFEIVRKFWQAAPYVNETYVQVFTRLGAPRLM